MKKRLLTLLAFAHVLSAGDPSSLLPARRRANSQPKSGPNSPLTERAKIEARIKDLEATQKVHEQKLAALAELLHGGRHEVKESKPVLGKVVHQRRLKGSKGTWQVCAPHSHDPSYEYRIIPATEEVTTIVVYSPVRQQLREHEKRITVLEKGYQQGIGNDSQTPVLPSIQSSKQTYRSTCNRWQNAACAVRTSLQPVQGQALFTAQKFGPGPA